MELTKQGKQLGEVFNWLQWACITLHYYYGYYIQHMSRNINTKIF